MNHYEVAVAAPITQTLTYGQPEGVDDILQPGLRVLVPLGNRHVTGFLLGSAEAPPVGDKKIVIKPIADLLDQEPIFPAELISLYRWISRYYHYPLGEVIRSALPGGLIVGSGRHIVLTDAGRDNLPIIAEKSGDKVPVWLKRLLTNGELAPGTVRTIWQRRRQQKMLASWQQEGFIRIESILTQPHVKKKEQDVVRLTGEIQKQLGNTSFADSLACCSAIEQGLQDHLTPAERKTLLLYLESALGQDLGPVPVLFLVKQYKGSSRAIKRLAAKGVVQCSRQLVYRDPFGEQPPYFPAPATLTDEQDEVLAQLLPVILEQTFQPFLLFGVTGCGKTEVYLRAAAETLRLGKTVLVLVPEIALATQLEGHFYSRFGDQLAIFHSGLTAGERFDQWQRMRRGLARIVIGARSAVFAPLPDLGLLIVDEEHEPAYKQDNGLRYHGRDLAVVRAKNAGCPVILGSATPSITSYYHTQTDKYRLLTMTRRVMDQKLPTVEIVDLSKEKKSRPDLLFSDQLITALHENMEKRQQSLLFVNRRGFASCFLCRDCGHIVSCRHCQVSLTLHQGRNQLVCHYCGYTLRTNIICPSCQSGRLTGTGVGSERIEAEVRELIPHARVARLDSDTSRDRKVYISLLKEVREHHIDILVGTQMIAKGLHFPNMTLVGVVLADSGLGLPDFRASERTFSLLSQVTGRAGRGEIHGRVIVQTYQPNHYAIRYARQHDFHALYEKEISERQELSYPPFSRMINIKFSGPQEGKVQKTAKDVASFVMKKSIDWSVDILGPAPAPLSRLKDRSRWQLLLKDRKIETLHALCDLLIIHQASLCQAGVKMEIDVDPENMM